MVVMKFIVHLSLTTKYLVVVVILEMKHNGDCQKVITKRTLEEPLQL